MNAKIRIFMVLENSCIWERLIGKERLTVTFVIHVRLFILSESDENLLLIFSNIL